MSSRSLVRTCAAVLPALLLAGCLDFETVLRPAEEPRAAEIMISAQLEDRAAWAPSTPSTARLTAWITPGTDARGARPMANDTLWVRERPLLPEWVEPDGRRLYQVEWWYDAGADVPIALPRIDRIAGLPLALTWRPVHRIGPDTLRLRQGHDLLLRLGNTSGSTPASPDSTAMNWSLWVVWSTGETRLSRRGMVPDSVVLPAAVLPRTASGSPPLPLQVMLQAHQERRIHSAGSDFHLLSHFTSSVSWIVELTDGGDDR